VVNFVTGLLYPRKEPQYKLNRRLGGFQSQSGWFGEEKNLLAYWDSGPRLSIT